MAEVACLISVRLFHRVQQQFPGFIVYLNFALALLGQFEGLLRLTQPVGRYGATDLLQLSLCGESLLSRDVSLRRTFSEVSIANLSSSAVTVRSGFGSASCFAWVSWSLCSAAGSGVPSTCLFHSLDRPTSGPRLSPFPRPVRPAAAFRTRTVARLATCTSTSASASISRG